MNKTKVLNRYQKGVLIVMMIMTLVFTAAYFITVSRVGFAYKNTILIPGEEKGNTVYTGKIQGKPAQFTVSEDKTVEFRYGDKVYGPYTAKEDPTAVPKDYEMSGCITGVELRQGEEILFRGGILPISNSNWLLYNEDGTLSNAGIFYATGDGMERDENGNIVDPVEPSVVSILELMKGPELTHKGQWIAWFGAVLLCLCNGLFVLFADELFRWRLSFRIMGAEYAEPTEWEIAGRYVGWTVLSVMALVLYVMGLQ